MASRKYTPEEIVERLRQVDFLILQGIPLAEAIEAIDVTRRTYSRWLLTYGAAAGSIDAGAANQSAASVPVPPDPVAAIEPRRDRAALERIQRAVGEDGAANHEELDPQREASDAKPALPPAVSTDASGAATAGFGPANDRRGMNRRLAVLALAASALGLGAVWYFAGGMGLDQTDRPAEAATALEGLRKQIAADRAELADMRSRLAAEASGLPADVARQSAMAARIDDIGKAGAEDRARWSGLDQRIGAVSTASARSDQDAERRLTETKAALEALRRQADSTQGEVAQVKAAAAETSAASGRAVAQQRQETDAVIAKMRDDMRRDRADVAALRADVDAALKAPTSASADAEKRKAEAVGRIEQLVVGQIEKLRQETMAARAGQTAIEKRLTDLTNRASYVAPVPRRGSDVIASTPPQAAPAIDKSDGRSFGVMKDTTETASVVPQAPPRKVAPPLIRAALPDGAFSRVVIRIAKARDAVQQKARMLERSLRAQGLDVVTSSDGVGALQANKVVYYYDQDRASAERIAAGVAAPGGAAPAPVRHRFSEDDSLPRPGTIEVVIVE